MENAHSSYDISGAIGHDIMLGMDPWDTFSGGEMLSDENSDPMESFFPEYIKSFLPNRGIYEENCPYRRVESIHGLSVVDKMFHLIEKLSDGSVYTGDSFGSHLYIDANEERACPQSCLCRLHDRVPDIFTFTADKSSAGLVVTIHSDALYSEVVHAISLGNTQAGNVDQCGRPNSVDGFALLKSYQILQGRLDILNRESMTDPTAVSIMSEMELLVHGFLTDGEVFKSFGYENLYENGFLSFEHWKSFQQDRIQKDISTLDEEFRFIDDVEGQKGFQAIQTLIADIDALEAEHEKFRLLLDGVITLDAALTRLGSLMVPYITTKKDATYRRLYKRFIQQHLLLTEAAHSSASSREVDMRFRDHREAWAAGIWTMRRLCNGKPPRGLDNTAAFLCISKAMSETLDATQDSDYTAQFLEDLDRWQVLFTSKALEAYRELIHSMWGIVLPQNKSRSWKASDLSTLTHFQSLLSTLIGEARGSADFHRYYSQTLECSQQRFRARNQALAIPEQQLEIPNHDSSGESSSQSPQVIEPKPPDIPTTPNDATLKTRIESDKSSASLDATLVVLMAGAIFVIVIIFLQWLRNISEDTTYHSMVVGHYYSPGIHNLQERCKVLTTYLNLRAHFALPSACSMALYAGIVDMPGNMNLCHTDDSNTEFEFAAEPFPTTGQMNYSENASQPTRSSSDSPEIPLQGPLSSVYRETVSSTPTLNFSSVTDVSSSDTSSTPTVAQDSTPAAARPLQKPRRQCPTCRKRILATNLKRHMKDHTGENKVKCRFCGKALGRKEYVQRHEKERCPVRGLGGENN